MPYFSKNGVHLRKRISGVPEPKLTKSSSVVA